MAQNKSAPKGAKKPAKHTGKVGFTDEERAAMREHTDELRGAGRRGKGVDKAKAEKDVLAKIASMPPPDRILGEQIHAIIKANAPALSPKLWYGMPAYANNDGNVVCFFQDAQKFKSRYATLGFSDKAHLDEGALWPVAFAVKQLNAVEEARIAALVKKAAG